MCVWIKAHRNFTISEPVKERKMIGYRAKKSHIARYEDEIIRMEKELGERGESSIIRYF